MNITDSKLYYVALCTVAALLSFINYHNEVMSGIWRYYEDFAGFFKSGCSSAYTFQHGYTTFPMWGYGLVFALTQSKAAIIVLQQVLSIFVLSRYVGYFASVHHEKRTAWLKIGLLLSFPLFLYNTAIAPYSIGSSLLFLGMLNIAVYMQHSKIRHLLYAAALFGLMLNFRSDYLYFLFLLVPVVLFYNGSGNKLLRLGHIAGGVVVLLIIMLPWMVYTHSQTRKYLLTSTNTGHQLYMSLGQYPGNPWGIEKGDNSPQMREQVTREFGSPKTLTYQADTLLRTRWKEAIVKDPCAYVCKIGWSAFDILKNPFYIGDIYAKHDATTMPAKNLLTISLNTLCRLFLLCVIALVARLVLRKKFIALIKAHPLFLICLLLIGYQVTMQSLAYSLFLYNTGTFLAYLLVFIYAVPQRKDHLK